VGRYKVPRLGESRVLVIPVNVQTSTRPRLDMKKLRAFFADQLKGFTFTHYWHSQSGGRLRVHADVIDPIEYRNCPFPDPDGKCTPARRNPAAFAYAIPLIKDIFRRAKSERGLDFSRYDINGPKGKPDGWSDGVIIIVNFGWFGVALPFGLVHDALIEEHDGVKIPVVAISGGRRGIYMSLHEYGHLLGFADLYDEWRQTYGLQFSPMGSWHYDRQVPALDALSRYLIGWADVVQIEGTQEVLIPPVAESGRIYKLGGGREFWLVENRVSSGPWDKRFKDPGLAIYHVYMGRRPKGGDNDFYRIVLDCPNCRRWRPFVMNEQADARFDIQFKEKRAEKRDLFRSGSAFLPNADRGRLSAANLYFNSNYYQGRASEVAVYDIDSQSYAPSVRATLKAPLLKKGSCSDLRCPKDARCVEGRCRKLEAQSYDWYAVIDKEQEEAQRRSSLNNIASALDSIYYALKDRQDKGDSNNDTKQENKLMDAFFDIDFDWRILILITFVAWLIVRKRVRAHLEKRDEEKDKQDS